MIADTYREKTAGIESKHLEPDHSGGLLGKSFGVEPREVAETELETLCFLANVRSEVADLLEAVEKILCEWETKEQLVGLLKILEEVYAALREKMEELG